jgi:hypothetical protein
MEPPPYLTKPRYGAHAAARVRPRSRMSDSADVRAPVMGTGPVLGLARLRGVVEKHLVEAQIAFGT